MAKRYALKGINDEETVCSVCGKVELRRVMWLVELDADGNEISEPFAVGTTCGAKLLGQSAAKVRKVAESFGATVRNRRHDLYNGKCRELGCDDLLKQLEGIFGKERFSHPVMAEVKARQAQAQAWADAQTIVVEF